MKEEQGLTRYAARGVGDIADASHYRIVLSIMPESLP